MEVIHDLVGTKTGLRIDAVFGAAGRSPGGIVGKLPRNCEMDAPRDYSKSMEFF